MSEYRICWAASSFRGATDWKEWDGPIGHGSGSIEQQLTHYEGVGFGISDGLEAALEASGFEWWVETR